MDSALRTLRHALRSLLRSPGFTVAAVLCLALGIGANATMFGIVDRLLLRAPAGVKDASRLVRVYFTRTHPGMGESTSPTTSYPVYEDVRDGGGRELSPVAAYMSNRTAIGRGAGAEPVDAALVSASFFPLVGIHPALGRFFAPDEDRAGGPGVVVISWALWQRRFAGSRGVLGRTLDLGNQPYTIVGVAPKGFDGIDLRATDIYLPIAVAAPRFMNAELLTSRNWVWMDILGRLRPGVPLASAERDLTTVVRRAEAAAATGRQPPPATIVLGSIISGRGPRLSMNARVSLWLAGVAALVLLIACANVANLMLARAIRRRREIAVRLALGAGRWRLVRELMVEGVLIALAGGVLAVVVARWGGIAIRSLLLRDGGAGLPMLDPRVLAFTAVVALGTGVLCALIPAAQASRPDVMASLKAGAREGVYQRSRARGALLVGQVALTLVLLVGAGLFIRSLRNVRALDFGFDPQRLLVIDADLSAAGYSPARIDQLYRRVLDRVQTLPGVAHASVAMTTPYRSMISMTLSVPGRDSIPRMKGGGPYLNAVTPDHFATMGTRIVEGRGFTAADAAGAPPVAVVSQLMARLLWPGERAIGKCFRLGPPSDSIPCREVVGIAEDLRLQGVQGDPSMQYYVPLDQAPPGFSMRALFVRTAGDPAPMVETVRRAVLAIDPGIPYPDVRPMSRMLDPEIRPWRLGATMFGIFGALALLLAAIGLYGVIAYTVAQRTHEMGVRLALGAQARDVVGLVVRQGMLVTALGVVIGGAAALAAGRWVASLLYGVTATDPVVFAVVALTLIAVAVLASWLPARRATRVDPAIALRAD